MGRRARLCRGRRTEPGRTHYGLAVSAGRASQPDSLLSAGQYDMKRRDFLAGAAALAAYLQTRESQALTGPKRVLSLSGRIPPALHDTFFLGLNLSGGEINFPQFPQLDEMTWAASRITKLFRVPLCWAKANWFFGTQGLQSTPFGALNATYLANLLTVLNNAASLGCQIIPDVHMFGSGP